MPTGYTATLYEGKPQTFEEFVWSCARAFGALMTMRDDSLDAPIPQAFEPSTYHAEAIDKAERRLMEVDLWTDDEAEVEAERDWNDRLKAIRKAESDRYAIKVRYEAMLARVEAWEAPTAEHVGLKEFMAEQLRRAIDFDTGTRPSSEWLGGTVRLTAAEYRAQQIERAERDIGYHTAEHEKELERTRTRNEWVAALRESLVGAS